MDKIIRFVSANCLLIWILLGTADSVSAQRFEWVRGYAAGENVAIVGSVTDSVGNLYILGSMNRNSCWENGSRLLPIVPQGGQDNGDVLIAKVSPDGDLVWHKVIHGNYTSSVPHDIKPLGDTAFACLVTMPLATADHYLYYLDTMIYSGRTIWDPNSGDTIPWPDYPMRAKYRQPICLAMITFDFKGIVLDQYFLQMSYMDCYGEDIANLPSVAYGSEPWLCTMIPRHSSFAIDGDENIYLSRWTFDQTTTGPAPGITYMVGDGTISAVKFWCNLREVGVAPADSHLYTSPQILKFSPHFDTLLESQYIFQNGTNLYDVFYSNHLHADRNNNIYYISYVNNNHRINSDMAIDSLRNIYLRRKSYNTKKGILIKYSPSLDVLAAVSLDDSALVDEVISSNNVFSDISFDYDSNFLFLNATSGRGYFGDTTNFWTIPICQSVPLTSLKNDAFFMSFKMEEDTLKYNSYGRVNAKIASDCMSDFPVVNGCILTKNNYVFLQSINTGGVRFPGQEIIWDRWADDSPGLTMFDYQGHVIGGVHYASFSPQNRVGPISLRDSTLYLINRLASEATFGDIHVPSRGEYFACIAKYTDSMFMSSYERPRDTSIVVEVVQEELTVVRYPNPTTGRLTLVMNGRPLREAYVAGMDGIAQPLPVAAIGNGIYCADLTGRPDGTYILVLVADDKHAYRCNVILQH